MKLEKIYMIYMGVVLAVLTVIGFLIAGASRPLTEAEQNAADIAYEATDFSLPMVCADHGPDETIVWKDAGMEAHIRFLLNKPEGEIRRSDVWDIQVLEIQTTFQLKFDILVAPSENNNEEMTRANTLNNSNLYRSYGNRTFPDIKSLCDLENFESLQVFSLMMKRNSENSLITKGLEKCKNLKVLQIANAQIDGMPELKAVEILHLQNCGEVGMKEIGAMEQLRALSLIECSAQSMEELTGKESLQYLNLLDTVIEKQETIPDVSVLIR